MQKQAAFKPFPLPAFSLCFGLGGCKWPIARGEQPCGWASLSPRPGVGVAFPVSFISKPRPPQPPHLPMPAPSPAWPLPSLNRCFPVISSQVPTPQGAPFQTARALGLDRGLCPPGCGSRPVPVRGPGPVPPGWPWVRVGCRETGPGEGADAGSQGWSQAASVHLRSRLQLHRATSLLSLSSLSFPLCPPHSPFAPHPLPLLASPPSLSYSYRPGWPWSKVRAAWCPGPPFRPPLSSGDQRPLRTCCFLGCFFCCIKKTKLHACPLQAKVQPNCPGPPTRASVRRLCGFVMWTSFRGLAKYVPPILELFALQRIWASVWKGITIVRNPST